MAVTISNEVLNCGYSECVKSTVGQLLALDPPIIVEDEDDGLLNAIPLARVQDFMVRLHAAYTAANITKPVELTNQELNLGEACWINRILEQINTIR